MNVFKTIPYLFIVGSVFVGQLVTGAERWDMKRLWDEAEIVCVASVDAVLKTDRSDFRPRDMKRLEAKLDIESIFKGKVSDDDCRFVFYQYLTEESTVANRPNFANFPNPKTQEMQDAEPLPRITYLFFLRQRADGSYGAVSGDLDSGLSVSKLKTFAATSR